MEDQPQIPNVEQIIKVWDSPKVDQFADKLHDICDNHSGDAEPLEVLSSLMFVTVRWIDECSPDRELALNLFEMYAHMMRTVVSQQSPQLRRPESGGSA
jgi:hypothetical protein